MAAALLHSLGVNELKDIMTRLMAATWPLTEADHDAANFQYGVIDLTKVAAVQSYAVEAIQRNPAGEWVRRTYVGPMTQKLDSLLICPGTLFSEKTIQAVRLSSGDASGYHTVTTPRRCRRSLLSVNRPVH
jgi:hypothetical protein